MSFGLQRGPAGMPGWHWWQHTPPRLDVVARLYTTFLPNWRKGRCLVPANLPVDGYEGADEGVPKRPTKQPRKPRKKKPVEEGHRTEDGDSETDSETGGKAQQKSAARVGRARRQQQAESSAAEDSSSDEDAEKNARRLRAAARAARAEQESCKEMPNGEADETVASSSDSDSRSSLDEDAVPKPKSPSPTSGPAGPSLRHSRCNADAPLPEPSPEGPSKRPRVAMGTAKSSFPTDQQRVWATDSYARVAASAVPESTPVSRAWDVTGVLENRMEHHLFHAAEYQLTLTTNTDFVHSNKRPQMYLGDQELLDAVILLTTCIIASWLQFPIAGDAGPSC
ncbi:hypothetical protein B0H11DRAFT_2220181 [Mycena galericulata]|nr:hypothetical protein B0H11DRAFT_2220181 [Mycena galericulata]